VSAPNSLGERPVPPRRGFAGRGGGRVSWVAAPPEWRGTTAQVCGLWPFAGGAGSPMVGVPVGRDLRTGETVCSDPISWFQRAGLILNPSVLVMGRPALGKSTLVRRMATGLAAYGILPIVAGDTKPDYVDLVIAMGGHVVNLARGQGTLNPLDPGAALAAARQLTGTARRRLLADAHGRRVTMVSALVTMNRQAAVSDVEEAVIAACLDVLDEHHTESPATLVEMLEVLSEGPEAVRRLTLDRGDDGRYRAAVHGLESSIAALLQGAMGDTFAHPTSTPVNVNGPLCIDISGIPDSDAKLKVAVLLACWGETFGALAAAQALADAGKAPPRLWFIVLDELWRVLRSGPGLVERVDSLTRLNRQEGVGMALVIHTLKDLVSLTSEEDRTKAKGFAERVGYLAIGGVPAGEVPLIQDVVALSGPEAELLAHWADPPGWDVRAGREADPPGRGKFLLKVGGKAGIPIQLQMVDAERHVHDTNKRWHTRAGD